MNTIQESATYESIEELSQDELELVGGGLVPLALAGAIIATSGTFSFTIGIFDGIREKYS